MGRKGKTQAWWHVSNPRAEAIRQVVGAWGLLFCQLSLPIELQDPGRACLNKHGDELRSDTWCQLLCSPIAPVHTLVQTHLNYTTYTCTCAQARTHMHAHTGVNKKYQTNKWASTTSRNVNWYSHCEIITEIPLRLK